MNEPIKHYEADSVFAKLVDMLHEHGGVALVEAAAEVFASEAEVYEGMTEDSISDDEERANRAKVDGIRAVSDELVVLARKLARVYAG